MLTFEGNRGPRFCDGLTRRDFLRVGGLSAGTVGLSLGDWFGLQQAGAAARGDASCILLFLVGGPSQLDTWDLKPTAPAGVRGPFRPVQTSVPGVQICEHFPQMAQMAERYAIVRSVHHDAAPIHETGHQLMQTGRLCGSDREEPHYGAVLSHLRGPARPEVPPFVVLPAPVGNTGVNVSHGQGAGCLGARHEPFVLHGDPAAPSFRIRAGQVAGGVDPARLQSRRALLDAIDGAARDLDATLAASPGDSARTQAFGTLLGSHARRAFDLAAERDEVRARYGRNTFGQSCLLARRLVENGVRLVTVNMFDTVFNKLTWDCHADGGSLATTLDDYAATLCPMFDAAYTALLDDLGQRGLLGNTLVVAMGEFGRTPRLNAGGGRDHHPGVWSVLFAGGGVRGGQVVGSSDRLGAAPRDRPVAPAEVAATIYRSLGIDLATRLPDPDGRAQPLTDAGPVEELFR